MVNNDENFRLELNLHAVVTKGLGPGFGDNRIIKTQFHGRLNKMHIAGGVE